MSNQTKDQAGELARFTPLKPMEEVLAENKAFMHASLPYRLRESLEFELATQKEKYIAELERLDIDKHLNRPNGALSVEGDVKNFDVGSYRGGWKDALDQAIERIKR